MPPARAAERDRSRACAQICHSGAQVPSARARWPKLLSDAVERRRHRARPSEPVWRPAPGWRPTLLSHFKLKGNHCNGVHYLGYTATFVPANERWRFSERRAPAPAHPSMGVGGAAGAYHLISVELLSAKQQFNAQFDPARYVDPARSISAGPRLLLSNLRKTNNGFPCFPCRAGTEHPSTDRRDGTSQYR